MDLPGLGSPFPEMVVNTTHGMKSLPGDYAGKYFVLFSHPGDFTPVCTTEFVGFQRRYDQFREMNCELIGLSIDQVFSHLKWVEWIDEKLKEKIEFPIIADEMGIVGKKLGMIHEGKGTNTVRAVFIVDDKGILRLMLYYPQEVGRNMDEITRCVKALQTNDKHKVALPANWPNGDFLGDRVIVPPAGSVEEIKKRHAMAKAGECEMVDWWFCHKKL
jgi:peroxiredoxin 2/4